MVATIFPTSVPSKRLASSITASSTSFQLNNVSGWDGNALTSADFGTKAYGVFRNPENTIMEIFEFDPSTIAAGSIDFVLRGLKFTGDLSTEVTANKKTWVRNETIVELGTDVPQLLKHFVTDIGDQTVAGAKTFSTVPATIGGDATAANELVRKSQLDDAVLGSLTNAPVIVPGNAGETVTVDQLVYLDPSDQEWKLADADAASTSENVKLGITRGAGTDGNAITNGVTILGEHEAASAVFTAGKVFASDTAGGFSASTGTKEVSLGIAKSTTKIDFSPRYDQRITEDQQDFLEKAEVSQEWYAASSVGTDSYAITVTPAITAYAAGMRFRFKADVANTDAATLAVSGLSAKTIKKQVDQDLASGDIAVNSIVEVVYDGTNFQMVSASALSVNVSPFGNGGDGDVVISGNTDLTKDMYYDDLTINTGITLDPKGFKIHVKGTLTCNGTGKIASNGNAGGTGGNGSSSTGGTGGSAGTITYSSGSLPLPLAGEPGGAGGDADPADGTAGDAGVNQAKALGDADAVAGGSGGDTDNANPGAGGAAGTKTGTMFGSPHSFSAAYNLFDLSGATITQFGVAPSSGGGGGGASGAVSESGGGGGGGSGSSGGVVWIAARAIASLNAESIGGNGGKGGDHGANGDAGGVGGGGGGGNGGAIILIYNTGSNISTDVSSGTGGAIGDTGTQTSAAAGANGNSGTVYTIVV